jgi:phage terminase large subunit-like protein
MKAYANKLMVGISTASDDPNSFGFRKIKYAADVASGKVKDDTLFSFLCRPDLDDKGECDFTDPIQQQKANPNWGLSIRPEEMAADAQKALNSPQERVDFLSRSMNVYTSARRAWFNIGEFTASDEKFDWTLSDLAKMKISWYGGADLSRTYDLTASALYGHEPKSGTDIVITHAFFPISQARAKAEEDSIPLFGWEDDGWLTMCNSDTVQYLDVVRWFEEMRYLGFRVRQVGFDRKFATDFVSLMEKHKFKMVDQPQYFWRKSTGFRHIEKQAKDGRLYYLHSEAYEYCVGNVHAIEKTDDMVEYHKIDAHSRMDLFDASVFACCKYLEQKDKEDKASSWWD